MTRLAKAKMLYKRTRTVHERELGLWLANKTEITQRRMERAQRARETAAINLKYEREKFERERLEAERH